MKWTLVTVIIACALLAACNTSVPRAATAVGVTAATLPVAASFAPNGPPVGAPSGYIPTPTPAYARFTAMDVVTTFRNFGMGADDPVPQTDPKDTFNAAYGSAPLGSGMAFKIMSGARLSGTLHVYVVVFREARDLEATWSHMVANPMQGSFIATNKYRNANLIFIYFYGTSTPPDMNPYIAAFIGMR